MYHHYFWRSNMYNRSSQKRKKKENVKKNFEEIVTVDFSKLVDKTVMDPGSSVNFQVK